MPDRKRVVWRYAAALAAIGTALALRELLRVFLGNSNPYHTVWVAIVFSAWYCGLGPSILASLLGALGVWYLFVPPYYSFVVLDRASIFGVIDFLFLSAFIVVLGEAIRRGESKRKKAERDLQLARELAYTELKQQVKERTRELEESNQQLRQLSARLIRFQDEERRKIARELHDSVGQYLVAVSMSLEAAKTEQASAAAIRSLEDAAAITKECASEVRTISHLLHPPLLEELGLVPAIRWYVEGFAARSGIQVSVEIQEHLARLGNDVELVLFRVLQESLTNIHRHSGSKTATIRLSADSQRVWLEVQDQGSGATGRNGSSNGFSPGIGTAGMRERLSEFAGVLDLASDKTGTRVKAVIPLARGIVKSTVKEQASAAG
jgi:signal transduction histidine kinase